MHRRHLPVSTHRVTCGECRNEFDTKSEEDFINPKHTGIREKCLICGHEAVVAAYIDLKDLFSDGRRHRGMHPDILTDLILFYPVTVIRDHCDLKMGTGGSRDDTTVVKLRHKGRMATVVVWRDQVGCFGAHILAALSCEFGKNEPSKAKRLGPYTVDAQTADELLRLMEHRAKEARRGPEDGSGIV